MCRLSPALAGGFFTTGATWEDLWDQSVSSVTQLSHSVVSDSLQPHGLQHTSPPCPLPTPRAYSDSGPLSRWCIPTISSSVILSPPPPAFNLCQHQGLFKWVSSLHQVAKVLEFQFQISVLPMIIQDWFPLGWTDWISLQSKGLSRVFRSVDNCNYMSPTMASLMQVPIRKGKENPLIKSKK